MQPSSPEKEPTSDAVTLPPLGPGSRLANRYRLLRLLGRGGMGVVWLAHDEQLQTDIALKLLADHLRWDEEGLRQIRTEARTARTLTHEHIVRVHDFLEDPLGVAITMEFVDGPSLSEVRAREPLHAFDHTTVLRWLEGICAALDHAHLRAGMVHRDLKPSNILITASGLAKVADFGLAKSIQDASTRVSQVLTSGTLLYMSPQQIWGETPSASDDLYALGATLYELLAGQPPFHSGDVSRQISQKKPESMSARREKLGIRGLAPLPRTWEEAVQACLSKEAAKRPRSAGALLERLRASGAGEVLRERRQALLRRARRPLAIALAAGLALSAGLLLRSRATPPAAALSEGPQLELSCDAGALRADLGDWTLLVPDSKHPAANATRHGPDRQGRPGKALLLNGGEALHLRSPQGSVFTPGKPFSIAFWFLPTQEAPVESSLLQLRDAAFDSLQVQVTLGAGRLATSVRPGNGTDAYCNLSCWKSDNTWHHLALVYEVDHYTLWLDGRPAATVPTNLVAREASAAREPVLHLGAYDSGRTGAVGALDSLLLRPVALSADAIAKLAADRPAPLVERPQFQLSKGIYPETVDFEALVREEAGPGASLADWEELRDEHRTDLTAFLAQLGLEPEKSAYVTRKGRHHFDAKGRRHYYACRFLHGIPDWFLAHDSIEPGPLALGSWYGTSYPALIRTGPALDAAQTEETLDWPVHNRTERWSLLRQGLPPSTGAEGTFVRVAGREHSVSLERSLRLRPGSALDLRLETQLGTREAANGCRLRLETADGRAFVCELTSGGGTTPLPEIVLQGPEGDPVRVVGGAWAGDWEAHLRVAGGRLLLEGRANGSDQCRLRAELPLGDLAPRHLRRLCIQPFSTDERPAAVSNIQFSITPDTSP